MQQRFHDLADLFGKLPVAEGCCQGPLTFSEAVPHGMPNSPFGNVMMSRIDMGNKIFVHASDIQLLDAATVRRIIEWQPDIVLAAGPPIYLGALTAEQRGRAWNNALHLCDNIDVVILDHHLMRCEEGAYWLDALGERTGKRVYCAADYMNRPRWLLEARRSQLYRLIPVPAGWHEQYAIGQADAEPYFDEAVLEST